jgi:cation/acetate symporter
MRAVTWTQVAQYIILIVAYLVPVVWLATKRYGMPIPELAYGQALEQIIQLEPKLGVVRSHIAPFADAAGKFSWVEFCNFMALTLCLMVGTASLPHILMRYFTTPSVREARLSVGWSIFFIFLLYFTAPAYAAFAKLEVYQNVIGQPIASLPAWVNNWHAVGGLLSINDLNKDGILQLSELTINQDIIVLSMPEVAGLPYVVSGLVAAGGLAAALSTADGLLLAIANALSHDVYYKMLDPRASTMRRLVVARSLLVLVAIAGAAVARTRPSGIIQMVAWAFSLAAAGLFAPLVMGIWWKRTTKWGAILGMLAGFGMCVYYLVGTRYFAPSFYEMWSFLSSATEAQAAQFMKLKQAWLSAAPAAQEAAWTAFDNHAQSIANWFGIRNISAALWGMPVAFLVIWIVSLMTPAPSREMQDFIDSIRRPGGAVAWGEKAHE